MTQRSKKQVEASRRAWTILRLRGAYNFFKEINCPAGMNVCNIELIKLGARSEREVK